MLIAHFTTNVVQLNYTIHLQKIKPKQECKGKIDIDYVKAAAWDKVIHLWTRLCHQLLKKVFIYMSQKIYILIIYNCEIFIESRITWFGENVIEGAPEYELIKQIKNSVFFVKNLCKKCLVFT